MRVSLEAILALLAVLLTPVAAQPHTPYELLDDLGAIPGVSVTHVNQTTYLTLGAAQTSEANNLMDRLVRLPGVNVTQVNQTACLLSVQPTETTIALRAANNRYVSLNVKNGLLYANSDVIGDSERLHFVEFGNGKVAFRGANGKYVGFRVYTGETYFIDSRYPECYVDSKDGASIFKKSYKEHGGYAFLAPNGKYLKVGEGDAVETVEDSSETFTVEVLDQIQDEIDDVDLGETIQLKEGIYRQTVTIDRSVDIIGAGSGHTFIDGNQQGSVFTIGKSNPNIDVGIHLLTIEGGLSENGGGISNYGRLTIYDVAMTRCTASNSGGGVFNHGSAKCAVFGVTHCSAESGAGIFNDVGSDLDLDSVLIENNAATGRGGGVLNKGNMHFGGGTIQWNEPDDVVDDTIRPSAGDLVSPAEASEEEQCGSNWWTCSRDSCKSLSDCKKCADYTRHAWSEPNGKCMGFQHACCVGKGNCKGLPKDEHGCDVCRCGWQEKLKWCPRQPVPLYWF